MDWQPREFDSNKEDRLADATYNVAAEISNLANAVRSLLYGLKFSKQEGLSIAESIESGLKEIAIHMNPSSRR